ncbi:MAG: hypothetical protein D3916_15690 [Candidatus Electrothrix sp. MAN1_4]|nr:hypothetical protein [Candidatus Electrothrix sp. MAN1_4]
MVELRNDEHAILSRYIVSVWQQKGGSMSKNKTVVISDVHLSNGSNNYSWFKDDTKLKGFLNEIAERADIKELVLLGDIFDLWLYPIDEIPWTAEQIIQHWSGSNSVVSALKKCADKLPDVYYINGNHDMGVTAADLALISPKMKFRTADQYNADHANKVQFEHGNLVDIFNAPDISGNSINGLPFGYFITRLVATAQNHDTLWDEIADIVRSYLRRIFGLNNSLRQQKSLEFGISLIDDWIERKLEKYGKLLLESIIDVLLDYVRIYHPSIDENSPILLPDGSSVAIGRVKEHYHKLLPNWYQKLRSLSDLYRSALASENLAWYAKKLLQDGPEKTVVMGHTHEGKILMRHEGQYANSGCWISDRQATYVEIDPADSPQAVVKAYPGNTRIVSAMAFAGHENMMRSSSKSLTDSSDPLTDEAAWEEEPLPQLWRQKPTE